MMFTNAFLKILLIVLMVHSLMTNIDEEEYSYDSYAPDYGRYGPTYFVDDLGTIPRIPKKIIRKKADIYADLLDPKLSVSEVTARLPTKIHSKINSRAGGYCKTSTCTACLESCKWLKKSRYSALDITQYTYLRLCSEGCKDNLACLMDSYCLPVMEENPDYFVLCANKCNLFEVIPQVFRTGQCD